MVHCKACRGTGLYSGMAEAKGCAVVCNQCNGTGVKGASYAYGGTTIKRKLRDDVERVFAHSAGYGHGPTGKYKNEKTGKYFNFEDGGCTYEEWLNGATPRPVKGLYCPYLWTQQGLQSPDKNGLYKNYCSKHLHFGSITDCNRYKNMDKCWDIYDNKDEYLEPLKLKEIIADYSIDDEQKIIHITMHHSLKNNTICLEWFNNEDNFLEFLLYVKNNIGSIGVMENFKNVIRVHHPKMYSKYRLMLEG